MRSSFFSFNEENYVLQLEQVTPSELDVAFVIEGTPYTDFLAEPEFYLPLLAEYVVSEVSWIDAMMRANGWVWAVACGTTIVAQSTDTLVPPPDTEQLERFGMYHGFIPVLLHTPDPISMGSCTHAKRLAMALEYSPDICGNGGAWMHAHVTACNSCRVHYCSGQ